ncbi:MAG: hypothetical protein L7S55_06020 [Luminiphilus sp.]|nr:hypothetical protein [Luminiphilus sp.]
MSIGAVPVVQQDGAGVNASATTAAGMTNTGVPNYGYSANGAVAPPNATVNTIPTVSDPDKAMADITRQQYLDFVNNYGQFEEDLIAKAQNDTSLIDQAREDVSLTQGLAQGIADRNASRYGAYITPAMRQQQQRTLQRQNTLGGIDQINNAKLAQREQNMGLLSDLINIGQGINRSSLDQIGSAAADAANRNAAYQNAKSASKAQTYSTLGSLGAMAIMAFAF